MKTCWIPLSRENEFHFSCTKDISCFNSCCRDLNQFLTPFDILKLKNHLGLTSGDFLGHYTTQHTGPASGLPIITLKPANLSELTCPFVTPSGCSVYEARPSSCRIYPIMRTIIRSRMTGVVTEYFMLLKEPHCRGLNQVKVQTVDAWIESQGLATYNEMNDMLMEIISLKNLHMPGQLDTKSRHKFRMALYDLDLFKEHLFNEELPDNPPLNSHALAVIKNDEIELLKFSHRWIKQILLNTDKL
jgi:Fe-S-cluster containining protein